MRRDRASCPCSCAAQQGSGPCHQGSSSWIPLDPSCRAVEAAGACLVFSSVRSNRAVARLITELTWRHGPPSGGCWNHRLQTPCADEGTERSHQASARRRCIGVIRHRRRIGLVSSRGTGLAIARAALYAAVSRMAPALLLDVGLANASRRFIRVVAWVWIVICGFASGLVSSTRASPARPSWAALSRHGGRPSPPLWGRNAVEEGGRPAICFRDAKSGILSRRGR